MQLMNSIRRLPFYAFCSFANPKRSINLQEFHCKKLLADHEINVQRFKLVSKPADVEKIRSEFLVPEYVIKAQIPAGGRGKGVFRDGFKGGVQLTKDPSEMCRITLKMLGNYLKTNQTPSDGMLVNCVMVAEALDIDRETYLAILMDRELGSSIIVGSKQGGMDIEDLAKRCPDSILKEPVDVNLGVTDEQADRVACQLGFKPSTKQHKEASQQIKKLYKLFTALDCTQVEINPFGETPDGHVVCFDAKLIFDENAIFRQPEIYQMASEVESIEVAAAGPTSTIALEVSANRLGLNYISLPEGNIGCIVNGAGLAMATMDLISHHGGKAANFLDLGGGVSKKQVEQAFRLLIKDSRIKCILVNIFGGIVNCKIVAEGLLSALQQLNVQVPIVVRLEGTNGAEARNQLTQSTANITTATTFDHAAQVAVSKASES